MRTQLRWRHLVLGVGFLGLAGVRAAQGAPVWALVFVLAAVAQGWLAVHEARRSVGQRAGGAATPRLERGQLLRALEGFRTSARQWQVLGGVGVIVGGALLFLQPWLAVFAAGAALFALRRAHRAGRSAATLRRAAYVR